MPGPFSNFAVAAESAVSLMLTVSFVSGVDLLLSKVPEVMSQPLKAPPEFFTAVNATTVSFFTLIAVCEVTDTLL